MSELKFAIVNKNQDLLRINPIKINSIIDFKISTLGNEYTLNYWSLGLQKPEYYHTHDEITYHSSTMKQNQKLYGIVQVKNPEYINYQYSFPRVTDIQIDTEFPIPLLKLSIAKKCNKIYDAKNYHVIFDLGDESRRPPINTVEIYITSKEYGEKFKYKWPFFDVIWTVSTIDYVVKGPELSHYFMKALQDSHPRPIMEMYTMFPKFNFLLRYYFDENINENMISFYENFDYISIIASTRIQLIDDITKVPLSGTYPAFVFDLERQRKQGYSKNGIKIWEKYFRKSTKKIDRLKIHRMGFLIPQIKE